MGEPSVRVNGEGLMRETSALEQIFLTSRGQENVKIAWN